MFTDEEAALANEVLRLTEDLNKAMRAAVDGGLELVLMDGTISTFDGDTPRVRVAVSKIVKFGEDS